MRRGASAGAGQGLLALSPQPSRTRVRAGQAAATAGADGHERGGERSRTNERAGAVHERRTEREQRVGARGRVALIGVEDESRGEARRHLGVGEAVERARERRLCRARREQRAGTHDHCRSAASGQDTTRSRSLTERPGNADRNGAGARAPRVRRPIWTTPPLSISGNNASRRWSRACRWPRIAGRRARPGGACT